MNIFLWLWQCHIGVCIYLCNSKITGRWLQGMKCSMNVSDNVNCNRRIWRNHHGRETLACHSSQTNSRSGIALVCQWYATPIAIMAEVLQCRTAQKHWPWQGPALSTSAIETQVYHSTLQLPGLNYTKQESRIKQV